MTSRAQLNSSEPPKSGYSLPGLSRMDYQAFFREQDARMNLPDDDFEEYLRRMGTYRRRYVCSVRLNLSRLKLEDFCTPSQRSFLLDQALATNNTSNPSFRPVQVLEDPAPLACEITGEELNDVIMSDPRGSSLISPIPVSVSMSRESGRTRNNYDPATETGASGTTFKE